MPSLLRLLAVAVALALPLGTDLSLVAQDLPPIPPIKRLLPPAGIEVPGEVQKELAAKLTALAPRVSKLTDKQHRPDIEIFTKAVAYALQLNEFYDKKDFDKARWALKQAEERLQQAEQGKFPWTKQTGLVVRGYRSSIDGSVQPYGLVIPDKHDFTQPCPLYVFLHGRGDKETDLHFLFGRSRGKGEIVPENAIVVHPFGRQCIGFKSAGEIDVLEAVHDVQQQYKTKQLPALAGFSMGGAGAWHIGAHYPNNWSVVAPGAGFVDVKRYQKLKPSSFPPVYEQQLWGAYDVPAYTRNLFNLPVVAYSGELDKQKDAADFMAESFQQEGRELMHLIGPMTEHKYHPEVKKQLVEKLAVAVAKPGAAIAPEAHLQTQTLRYNAAGWLAAEGLDAHWRDSRLDGRYENGRFEISTKNVNRLIVQPTSLPKQRSFVIDGQTVEVPAAQTTSKVHFARRDGKWQWAPAINNTQATPALAKTSGLQGPIDDAFLAPFVVVVPSGKSVQPRVQQWIDFEIAHLRDRWAATFRGELPVKKDTEVTAADLSDKHLICFGDPDSNQVIRQALPSLPLTWSKDKLEFGGKSYNSATHLPALIYPNPLQRAGTTERKYLVLNSGPTFREAHDRTNSLQNPKLPDWAIVDITTPPDGSTPGKIIAADFFDEQWRIKTASEMR